MNITIDNGQVLSTDNSPTQLHISQGKILAIGTPPTDFQAEQHIDAQGGIIAPGFIDLSVRLAGSGNIHKGAIEKLSQVAVKHGVTTFCCPPGTTPKIDTPAVAELLKQYAKQSGHCQILPLAALTQDLAGQYLSEMGELKRSGCVAVTNAKQPIENTEVLRNAYAYAKSCGLTVFEQAIDPYLGRNGHAHEGVISTRLGLAGIPAQAESIAVYRALSIAELTGVRLHLCRLSTAKSVELVRQAQAQGLAVSADVSIQQLFLTDMDVLEYNSQCHVYPPLRSQRDKDALRQGLKDGVITALCSDNHAYSQDAKLMPFANTAWGISTLTSLLPLTLRLAKELNVEQQTALHWITQGPADILELPLGRLDTGLAADISIFQPDVDWHLDQEKYHNSPFSDWQFHGKVTHSLVAGQLVFSADGSTLN